MPATTEEYQTVTAYICKSPYEPSAICHPDVCKPKKLTQKSQSVFGITSSIELTAHLIEDKSDDYEVTAFLLADGEGNDAIYSNPSCDNEGIDWSIRWYRDGDDIVSELPLIRMCGVDGFRTRFSPETVSFSTPEHLGEIEDDNLHFTYEKDRRLIMRTDLKKKHLMPGEAIEVSFKVDGSNAYHPFARYSFQTKIFTTGIFRGCGLMDKIKVLNNPADPDDGFHYEYHPAEGGIGERIRDEWGFDDRLLWAVEHMGELFWIRSVSGADYEIGQRVVIAKSMKNLPLISEPDVKSNMVKERLTTSDFIVPEHFYSSL